MVKGLEIQGTRVALRKSSLPGSSALPVTKTMRGRSSGRLPFELAVEAPAVQDRHPQVAHDEVVADHRQLFQRGAAGVDRVHIVAVGHEHVARAVPAMIGSSSTTRMRLPRIVSSLPMVN